MNMNDGLQNIRSMPPQDDEEEFINVEPMPPLGDKKEVKERKVLKIVTPNRLLTKLPVLLAQIKVENKSCKVKPKSNKFCIFSIFW